MSRLAQLAALGTFLLGTLVAAYYAFTSGSTTVQSQLATGVLGSLVASVVYSFVTFYLVRESAQDKEEFKSLMEELKRRDLQGVSHIRAKTDFQPEFWVSLLSSATRVLHLSGHALSQWCEEPYRGHFITTLRRVALHGGSVKILLMDPEGDTHKRRQQLVGRIYTDRIRTTLETLGEVYKGLPAEQQGNIVVKWNGAVDLFNVYIRTDTNVLVSPYLTTMNSHDAIQLVLTPDSRFGTMYKNDFEAIFNRLDSVDVPVEQKLAEWGAQYGRKDPKR